MFSPNVCFESEKYLNLLSLVQELRDDALFVTEKFTAVVAKILEAIISYLIIEKPFEANIPFDTIAYAV